MAFFAQHLPGGSVLAAHHHEHAAGETHLVRPAQAMEHVEPARTRQQTALGRQAEEVRNLADTGDRRVQRRNVRIEIGGVPRHGQFAQIGDGPLRKGGGDGGTPRRDFRAVAVTEPGDAAEIRKLSSRPLLNRTPLLSSKTKSYSLDFLAVTISRPSVSAQVTRPTSGLGWSPSTGVTTRPRLRVLAARPGPTTQSTSLETSATWRPAPIAICAWRAPASGSPVDDDVQRQSDDGREIARGDEVAGQPGRFRLFGRRAETNAAGGDADRRQCRGGDLRHPVQGDARAELRNFQAAREKAAAEAARTDDGGFDAACASEMGMIVHEQRSKDNDYLPVGSASRRRRRDTRRTSWGTTTKANASVTMEPTSGFDQNTRTEPSDRIID